MDRQAMDPRAGDRPGARADGHADARPEDATKDVEPGDATSRGPAIEHEPTVTFVPVGVEHPVLDEEEASHVEGVEGWALVVERGPRAGMTWVLPPGETLVGRTPDADILLDDITVSRRHARFLVTEDRLVVEDLGSTNGTYVNGRRVDRAELGPGDEVLIGKFHLVVVHGGDA